MPAKTKVTPAGGLPRVSTLKPPMLHDVTNRSPAINAASRRRMIATQTASTTANHSRRAVSERQQPQTRLHLPSPVTRKTQLP